MNGNANCTPISSDTFTPKFFSKASRRASLEEHSSMRVKPVFFKSIPSVKEEITLKPSFSANKLQRSPLEPRKITFSKKERAERSISMSPLSIAHSVKISADESIDLEERELLDLRLYIFRSLFGSEKVKKQCFGLFFNSTALISAEIEDEDKIIFLKSMILSLTWDRAEILAGKGMDERQIAAMKEIQTYIKEKIPQIGGVDTVEYIESIAGLSEPLSLHYHECLGAEKFNFLRRSLSNSYAFFEYFFSSSSEEFENIAKMHNWFYYDLKHKRARHVENSASIHRLYEHLGHWLVKPITINPIAIRALFAIVLSYTDQFKEKLNGLFELLVSTGGGRQLLCRIDCENLEEWLGLLDEKQTSLFFNYLINSIGSLFWFDISKMEEMEKYGIRLLNSGLLQLLQKHLSPDDQALFLRKMLAYPSSKIYLLILENDWLMSVAHQHNMHNDLTLKAKYCLSFDALTSTPEIERSFASNQRLISAAEVKVNSMRNNYILTTDQVNTINNTLFAMELNHHKEDWLISYKKIWSLAIKCWKPDYTKPDKIRKMIDKWNKVMLNRLANYEEDAYNPKYYTLNLLPKKIHDAVQQVEPAVQRYEREIEKMTIIYERITQCRQEYALKTNQSEPAAAGYESFKQLIKEIAKREELNPTEEEYQKAAKLLTKVFIEIASFHQFPIIKIKKVFKNNEICHIKNPFSKLFINLLKEDRAIKIKDTDHSTPIIFLKEKRAKSAIERLLPLIQQTERNVKTIKIVYTE